MQRKFQVIGAFIYRAAEFQNDAFIIGVHCKHFNIVSKVALQNYGQDRFVAELKTLRREVCMFKHRVVNMCVSICISGPFSRKLHLSDHLVEDILRFGWFISVE